MCGHRYVLFDNMTRDQMKRMEQVEQLILLVNAVSNKNSGKPYIVDNLKHTEMVFLLCFCYYLLITKKQIPNIVIQST